MARSVMKKPAANSLRKTSIKDQPRKGRCRSKTFAARASGSVWVTYLQKDVWGENAYRVYDERLKIIGVFADREKAELAKTKAEAKLPTKKANTFSGSKKVVAVKKVALKGAKPLPTSTIYLILSEQSDYGVDHLVPHVGAAFATAGPLKTAMRKAFVSFRKELSFCMPNPVRGSPDQCCAQEGIDSDLDGDNFRVFSDPLPAKVLFGSSRRHRSGAWLREVCAKWDRTLTWSQKEDARGLPMMRLCERNDSSTTFMDCWPPKFMVAFWAEEHRLKP